MVVPPDGGGFLVIVLLVAVLGGATAAIAGFGIGSLLTPVIAAVLDVRIAIAVVAIPHALATVLRAWRLRREIDWRVLRTFGFLSAAGGLMGAVGYARLPGRIVNVVLGSLLLLTAAVAIWNLNLRWRPTAISASALGVLSGFFGGVAGNQGGMRAAALLAFSLTPAGFVATSTAVGVLVDAVRLPVYVLRSGGSMAEHAALVAVASTGVVIGTFAGERLLFGLAPARFRQVVAALVGVLGIWLLARG